MTVHSAPLNLLNKNIATPLNQNDLINRKMLENFNNHISNGENSNAYQNGIKVTMNQTNNVNTNISTTNNITTPNYQVSLFYCFYANCKLKHMTSFSSRSRPSRSK